MDRPVTARGADGYVRRLQEEGGRGARELAAENDRLRGLLGEATARLREAEDESRLFAARCSEVQRATSNLAALYVATQRLHGTLNRDEVLEAVRDVLANMLGCESAAVFERGPGEEPRRIDAWGTDGGAALETAARRVMAEGRTYVSPDPQIEGFHACVPLRLDGRAYGALALVRLLPQKAAIEPRDHELLELLASHAAVALYFTGLHAAAAARAR